MTTATARRAPATPRRTSRPPLALVAPVPSRAPRAPFVVLALLLVGAAIAGLLVLNTVVAQDAFALHDMARRSAALDEREQALRQQVAALEAPGALAATATRLGLVPAGDPVFLTPDGRTLGNPAPAKAPYVPPPAPSPAPSISASAKP